MRPYQDLFFTRFEYDKLVPAFGAKKLDKLFYEDKDYAQLVVTGIASPQLVHNHLKQFSGKVETLSFPDHHSYSKEDINTIKQKFESIQAEKKIIVTTEKDLMRFKNCEHLSGELKKALYFLPVKVQFLDEDKKSFNRKILNYVGENKSNRELHKRKNSGKS